LVYIITPLLWSALNQGRIDILVIYLFAPLFIFLKPLMWEIEELSWRRVFSITLLVTVVCSFSPLLLALWMLFHICLVFKAFARPVRNPEAKAGWIDLIESKAFEPIRRRFAVVITTFLLTMPWSLGALIHPTQFLIAPGIPVANGGTLQTLLTNPGGAGSPPWWVIAPLPLLVLLSSFIKSMRRASILSASLLGLAIVLNDFHITGHGATESVYVGALFIVIMIMVIPPILAVVPNVIPNLAARNLGLAHFAIAIATISSLFSTALVGGWALIGQSTSLVQSDQSDVVPAFVSALAQTPARPKTLVLSSQSDSTTFSISRGNPLQLGDADVATTAPAEIDRAITDLVAGSGVNSAKTLGSFGIHYLFLRAPYTAEIARAIDGVGGFTRMSSTNIGIVWRILGASPRVMLTNVQGKNTMIPAGDVGALGDAPSAGTITVAEKYDRNWRLISNGVNVPLQHATSGLPIFTIPASGKVTILFDGTAHRALISIQLLALLVAIVMALPSGRRRRQVPLEELV
jgi:hypothetical protein